MVTPKLLSQVELSAAFVAVYTAPVGIKTILRNIHLCDLGTGSIVQVALIANGESVTNKSYVYRNLVIGADEAFSIDAPIIIESESSLLLASNNPVAASVFGAEYSSEAPTILHNSLTGIQGGQAGDYYHLTLDELTTIKQLLGM